MNAVDTNVYVYALDAAADTVLMWQVAAEFLNQLRNWEAKGKLTATAVEAAFQRFRSMFPLRVPGESVFQISFDLRARFSLSHWDAMLLAACKEAGVTRLYSEDMDAGTDYDGLAIVNPFV